MLCEGVRQGCLQVAGGIVILGKVGSVNRSFDISAEVSATGLDEGDVRSLVDEFALLELDL